MRKLYFITFGILLIGGIIGCSKLGDVGPDTTAIYQANLVDIQNYVASKGLTGQTTTSGLFFALTKGGTSYISPSYGQEVEFNYKLYTLLGPSNSSTSSTTVVIDKLVDTSYATTPIYYPFFQGSLMPGLEEGLLKMHEGEEATLIMPSLLAFGSTSSNNGSIPANSPVRYDVRLIRSRTEDQQIDDYITGKNLTVTQTTTDGVRFILTKANPTGAVPKTGQILTINYAGKLLRATSGFDGGTGTGTKTVGVVQYLSGFEEGLALLKVGEKATVIFPSSLGYGASGVIQNNSYIIPPYAPLSFDIEVVSAQ